MHIFVEARRDQRTTLREKCLSKRKVRDALLAYFEVSRGHSVRIDVPDFDLSPLDGSLHICDGFSNCDRCFGLLIGLQNSRRLVRNLELRKLTAFPDSGLPL